MSADDLDVLVADAARMAYLDLQRQHPESYYYFSLITTAEGHCPFISAWSIEALTREAAKHAGDNDAMSELKWSYADSPYCCFGESYFASARQAFEQRSRICTQMSDDQWESELRIRLDAMERAMQMLDSEGLFGTGSDRDAIVILVELMPPDHTNTERAVRLNPGRALIQWLTEAAEHV